MDLVVDDGMIKVYIYIVFILYLFFKYKHLKLYLIEIQLTDKWDLDWDDLKIIKQIGSGSYGSVCLAKWRSISVAVKTLRAVRMSE